MRVFALSFEHVIEKACTLVISYYIGKSIIIVLCLGRLKAAYSALMAVAGNISYDLFHRLNANLSEKP